MPLANTKPGVSRALSLLGKTETRRRPQPTPIVNSPAGPRHDIAKTKADCQDQTFPAPSYRQSRQDSAEPMTATPAATAIPAGFRPRFQALPETAFRADISSTELRAQSEGERALRD